MTTTRAILPLTRTHSLGVLGARMRLAGLRAALLTAACAAASCLAAAADASPPLSPQLTFAAFPPPSKAKDYGTLLQLEYDRREAMTGAVQHFEALDMDVWFAGKRRNRHGHLAWHALVRQESLLDATRGTEVGLSGAVSRTAVSVQNLFARNPTLSTSYSRTLSAASVANLTSRVLPARPGDAGPINLDDPIHDTYHPYEQIHTILNRFQDAFPGWVEVITLGQSSQGRDIWAVKVTKPSPKAAGSQDVAWEEDQEDDDDGDEDDDESVGPPPLFSSLTKKHKHRPGHGKLKFLIAGTQHSREWIAASTVLYLVHELVALDPRQGGTAAHRKLLEQVEFTFVPVVNPDGYVYAWEHDRLWRKSRQPVGRKSSQARSSSSDDDDDDDDDISPTSSTEDEHEECLGIDLNRNWGYQFRPGTRPNPCSDSYPGAKAFESVELQALRDYMLDGVDAFLDVHSFGQMLLFPYSYSCDVVTPDQENHYEAVLQAAKALRDVHGRVFETGSVCEVSLTSPGQSLDWAYAMAKIRWSFATELRDGGIFGFLLPPAQIRPSGEEMSAALRRLTQFILDKEAGKR